MDPTFRGDTPPGYAVAVKSATPEPCRGQHWLQLVVLTALLIMGLLGMHALIGGCADAMNGGDSTCVSAPTAESIPALPVPFAADQHAHDSVHHRLCSSGHAGGVVVV